MCNVHHGIGAASTTGGVVNQLQGRIFALLYLEPQALTLDEIARELEQSKSNVSVNIRARSNGIWCGGSWLAGHARTTTRLRPICGG
jgi:hypothetical protein